MLRQKRLQLEIQREIVEIKIEKLYKRLQEIENKILENQNKAGIQYSQLNKKLNKKACIINCVLLQNLKARLHRIGEDILDMDFYYTSMFHFNHPEFDIDEFSDMLEGFRKRNKLSKEQERIKAKQDQEDDEWIEWFLERGKPIPNNKK